MTTLRRDDDLIREVEELRARLLALAGDESAFSRDRIADDLSHLLRELKEGRDRIEAKLHASDHHG